MSYIQTLSGKKFNYLTATIDDIDVEDIATALSNICRFAGHLPEFYSVAQHSVLVSQIVPPEFAFEALKFDDFQIVHYGGSEDYAKGYIDCQNNYNKALTAAGIGVKGK